MSFGGFSFGQQSSAAPAAAPAPAANPSSFGNFGAAAPAANTQPAAGTSNTGGSLFGNVAQNQQQQGQTQPSGGTSLFGSFGAKPATPAAPAASSGGFGAFGQAKPAGTGTGTGLFGSTAPAAPAGGTGLFGSTAGQPAQQQQQQTGTGLFGSTAQQPAQQRQTSLFGSTAQPTQPSTGTGLFGSTSQPAQPSTGTGLFGSTSQPQNTGTGLFGSTNQARPQQQGNSLFGQSTNQPGSTSLFGATAQPAQNQPQGTLQTSTNQAGSSSVEKTTKFTDLPEVAQKYIEQLDNHIKAQKAEATGLQTEALGRAIWQTSLDIKTANEEYSSISHTLSSLTSSLTHLREKMMDQGRDVERLREIWEIYSSAEGRMGQARLGAYREFPQEFFGRVANQMDERVGRYKKTITQLNRVVTSLGSEYNTTSPQAIAQTINNHQQAVLTLAAQLDQLQLKMNGLKAEFTAEWRDKTGSVRDPFEMAREERVVKA
ncbi:hypothetical protein IAT38_004749 [Cryptococcus sp. DSM 104549]